MSDSPPPDDRRPVTRFARLTRWIPTPPRVWRWWKARPKAAAFLFGIVLLLGWGVSDHVIAAWTGHRLRSQGHGVTFGHTIDEDLRGWAPLPTDSSLYLTPVTVSYAGDADGAGSLDEFLDAVERMPGVSLVHLMNARNVTREQAGRAATCNTGPTLILQHCSFQRGGFSPFASLPQLEAVFLTECFLPPGELGGLIAADHLKRLELYGTRGVAGSLASLSGHEELATVDALDSDLNDIDFAALARCPSLESPYLAGTDISDAGLAALNGRVLQWESLLISRTAVTDAGLDAIGSHPAITLVDLRGTSVGDAGVASVTQRCPNLKELWMARTRVTDEGVAALRPVAGRLEWLDLAETAVTGDGLAALGRCPQLKELSLSYTAIEDADLAAFPHRYPKLRMLELINARVTPQGKAALWKALPGLGINISY
ncbi:leucine-rich repeat domain-containing protein [Alienimonas chondri]|uniref:Leucine Rich repeats (2 copies) n=1 Tax=Alienimonas chondri TaxID=2681879 RepID=A0ABX1VG10_9PLAN|nr:hypothetical protein [Alienimonas chondri]NNJ27040.1 hypothetical protein [Alienimonas chondri]